MTRIVMMEKIKKPNKPKSVKISKDFGQCDKDSAKQEIQEVEITREISVVSSLSPCLLDSVSDVSPIESRRHMDWIVMLCYWLLIITFLSFDFRSRFEVEPVLETVPKMIYPLNNAEDNWITDEEPLNKRPPTPPRW